MLPTESKIIFCGHRVDPTRGDFYAGCPSKLPAEVSNVRHDPRRGHPQMPLLKKRTPAGGVPGPSWGAPWASQKSSKCNKIRATSSQVQRCPCRASWLNKPLSGVLWRIILKITSFSSPDGLTAAPDETGNICCGQPWVVSTRDRRPVKSRSNV
eukprot:gene9062-biopygen12184